MDERALGKRLQLARRRAGLTQQELCQKAALSYSTLAKIERGAIRSPSVFTVATIAQVTGVPLEDLMNFGQKLAPHVPPDQKKRSKTGVRFVYFDVNGTLARYYERAFTQIAEQTGVSVEIVETMFLHYDGAACRSNMANEEVEQIFATEFGIDDFNWQKYYLDNVEATPGSVEMAHWVAEYYEAGLLTNNWLGFTDELIKRKIVPDVKYKAIVESAKVGCSKPEAKIYEIAQGLAGVPADEILLVDDKHSYLAGAEKAGWQSLWFDEADPVNSIERVKKALEF